MPQITTNPSVPHHLPYPLSPPPPSPLVDPDGSGGLDAEEFETAVRILCPTLSSNDCKLIFTAIDVNGDKQISYTEFLAASLDPRCVDIAELNKAFHVLDSNGDGFISSTELDALYHLKLQGNGSATALLSGKTKKAARGSNDDGTAAGDAEDAAVDISVEILEMMASCDHDKDGRISYEEFIWGMTGQWAKEIIGQQKRDADLLKLGNLESVACRSSCNDVSINASHASLSVRSVIHDHVDAMADTGAALANNRPLVASLARPEDGELKSDEIFADDPHGILYEFSGQRKFSHTSHAILDAEPTISQGDGGDKSIAMS